jgi:uncharacterized protein
MLTKALDFEFKATTDKRIFEGYASTWDLDLGNDIIEKGAFQVSIKDRFPKGRIKVLWQHSDPIGIPVHIEEDSKGLFVKAKISKTRLGDEVLELMNDGVIDQMSIGYDVLQDELSDDGKTRHLKELKLYEFSPVTFPMNEQTSITRVQKSRLEYEQKLTELTVLLKEGRKLNRKNVARISDAIKQLQAVLTDSENDNDDDKKFYNPSDDSYKDIEIFTNIFDEINNYTKERK